MITFRRYINEVISRKELKQIEQFADNLFNRIDIDVKFTRHFFDRLNDFRNRPDIRMSEVIELFQKLFKDKKEIIKKLDLGDERVINDLTSSLNLPFKIEVKKNGDLKIMALKTIMRKKNFKSSDPKIVLN